MAEAAKRPIMSERAWVLYRRSHQLFHVGRFVHGDLQSPTCSIPLVAQAVRLLLCSIVIASGAQPPADEQLRSEAHRLNRDRRIYRWPIEDELPWLSELAAGVRAGDELDEADLRRYARLLKEGAGVFAQARSFVRRSVGLWRRSLPAAAVALGVVVVLALLNRGLPRETAGSDPAVPQCIQGTYFKTATLEEPALERCDPTIDFDWGQEAPVPGVPADGFSVRWQGRLSVPKADTYIFFLRSDDGSRLFVDDQLLIDHWGDHAAEEKSAEISLAQGPVSIRVEFYDAVEMASVRLAWSTGGEAKTAVPASRWVTR